MIIPKKKESQSDWTPIELSKLVKLRMYTVKNTCFPQMLDLEKLEMWSQLKQ